jgi:hypothetical protein
MDDGTSAEIAGFGIDGYYRCHSKKKELGLVNLLI